ncbi:hypothetical protein D3C75_937090 [compost metagenome]
MLDGIILGFAFTTVEHRAADWDIAAFEVVTLDLLTISKRHPFDQGLGRSRCYAHFGDFLRRGPSDWYVEGFVVAGAA